MLSKWKFAILVSILPLAALAAGTKEAAHTARDPEPGVPHLVVLPPQRVLTYAAKGDPNEVAGKAFKELYRVFYAKAGKNAKRRAGPPIARWPTDQVEGPKSGWQGTYALPVPDSFPDPADSAIKLETWEYGMTAQILHAGSYDSEGADIAALKEYIVRSGLAIRGEHEEVYLKGPGMLFKGAPRNYRTLIRYAVERIAEPPAPVAGGPEPAGKPADGLRQ